MDMIHAGNESSSMFFVAALQPQGASGGSDGSLYSSGMGRCWLAIFCCRAGGTRS